MLIFYSDDTSLNQAEVYLHSYLNIDLLKIRGNSSGVYDHNVVIYDHRSFINVARNLPDVQILPLPQTLPLQ